MSPVEHTALTADLLPRRRALIMGACMAATGAAAVLLKPNKGHEAPRERLDLEGLIPQQFGNWKLDASVTPLQPNPELLAKVEMIYDVTLARTYINTAGQRVMLSIAYGGDQTGRLRVHRPESCYSAQGFQVKLLREEVAQYGRFNIPVKRLHAQATGRSEPITYWIRVGDRAVTGNIGQRLVQLKYGLTGEVPDGLIFRVSSIAPEDQPAFLVHDQFVSALGDVLSPQGLSVIAGTTRTAAPTPL